MSKAEEYDRVHNVQPQAGTSHHISQHSQLDQPLSTRLIHKLDETDLQLMDTLTPPIITCITPKYKPPSRDLIASTMTTYNIPQHRTQAPFYADRRHCTGAVDVGCNTLRILGRHQYDEFDSAFTGLAHYQKALSGANGKQLTSIKLSYCSADSVFMEPTCKPPSVKDVKLWLLKRKRTGRMRVAQEEVNVDAFGVKVESQPSQSVLSPTLNKSSWDNSHAISGVSLNNTHGFKMTLDNLQEARSLDIYQFVTSLVMELHTETRGDCRPDPQVDPVQIVFFALVNDIPDGKLSSEDSLNFTSNSANLLPPEEKFLKGFICVSPTIKGSTRNILTGTGIDRTKYTFVVPDEASLYKKFLELYHKWNPDILMGYEIEQASWGYLVDRGYVLGLNLPSLLSRIKDEKSSPKDEQQDELQAHLKITGRIVLDLWRLLKHEIPLQSYTFENMAYHILHERVPHFSHKDLSLWWHHMNAKLRHRTIDYYLYRVEGAFRLIDHYDLIGRTAELARLFGILFYEVLSRGSQFRVESMMLRLAKAYNFIPVSPNVQQRAHMKAPEFLSLILEPESKFYTDPVIVLDFQSLYPSIIIAYNYCFSTCLGRVEHLASDEPFDFGACQLEVSRKLVGRLLRKNLLTVSPCGVAFVKDAVRPGIMPRMLREILDTRLMVKKSMKKNKGNKTLQKVLHSRQLGLKLIANVTYGYTAANFSGRMPAVELGDSVVSKGRETLQRAIKLVEKNTKWGVRVVYGDTDSMFVLCAGKSRQEAFQIGEEIADLVTKDNPSPIKLKLEKVYQPCILQTKKRYVGYMYETADQKHPEFEAKGIETVRRDGCPAASKMLEKCLRLLFDHRDVSQVRDYVLKQFGKILSGRVSLQDLTFAKEYRGKEGYRPGACVPALELTRKWMTTDKRKEPRNGERVPYVIVNGPPGLPLIKLVRSPHDLLDDPNLRPNGLYYITKAIIPPINRCFKLIGADLFTWFNDMPRKHVQYLHVASPNKGPKSTISQYFATAACASCGMQTKDGLCPLCLRNPSRTIAILHNKVRIWERNYFNCKKICESCCSRSFDLGCNSLDCPVLYRIKQTTHDFQQTEFVRSLLDNFQNQF